MGKILKLLMVILGATLLWRAYIFTQTSLPTGEYIYMMNDTRIDSLDWGCLLSVMMHVNERQKAIGWLMGYIPVVLAGLAILASFLIRDETFRYTLRFSLQGFALFVLFLNLFFTDKFKWVVAMLEWKVLAWFGTVSYALYLWHVPIIDICVRLVGDVPMAYGLALVLSLYAAAFSYYIVEKRFLNLRKQFGSHGIVKGIVKNKAKAPISS